VVPVFPALDLSRLEQESLDAWRQRVEGKLEELKAAMAEFVADLRARPPSVEEEPGVKAAYQRCKSVVATVTGHLRQIERQCGEQVAVTGGVMEVSSFPQAGGDRLEALEAWLSPLGVTQAKPRKATPNRFFNAFERRVKREVVPPYVAELDEDSEEEAFQAAVAAYYGVGQGDEEEEKKDEEGDLDRWAMAGISSLAVGKGKPAQKARRGTVCVEVEVQGKKLKGLWDSGASLTCLSESKLPTSLLGSLKASRLHVRSVTGEVTRVKGWLQATLTIQGRSDTHWILIVPHLSHDFIFGVDFLRSAQAREEWSKQGEKVVVTWGGETFEVSTQRAAKARGAVSFVGLLA